MSSTDNKQQKSSQNTDNQHHKPPKKKKSVFKKIMQGIGIFLLICFVIGIAGVGGVYFKLKPRIDQAYNLAFTKEGQLNDTVFKRAGTTQVLDKDGKLISNISSNDFKYAEFADVSTNVMNGYIAVEDKDFLKENGISYKGIARAAYQYVKNKGKVVSGGSTITQQLIKNTLLTQERTFDRKLTEIFLAPKIEKKYTKQQILEFYVNNCYYGEGCYGIYSASQYFFSKNPSDLTLAESATLCGLSNNPTMFSPVNNPEDCTKRRNIVLQCMLEQGYITQDQFDEAKNTKLTLNIKQREVIEENYMSSYAVNCAVKGLLRQEGFTFKYWFETEEDREAYQASYLEAYSNMEQKLRSGGYIIHTSFDQTKQQQLQESLDNGLSEFTETDPATGKYKMQGASVCIDNETGYVVAIVGGRGTTDLYNRAFLSQRQPGSSIKPIVSYAPAFDLGYHPLSVLTDEKQANGPANDDFVYQGKVTLRYAVEVSKNTCAYNMLQSLKPKTGLSYLEKMHYTALHPMDNNPIIAVGGFTEGVTPVAQAGAYHALENQGYFTEPSCVTKIEYLGTETIYENKMEGEQVYSPASAYMMTDVMRGVIEQPHGTGRSLAVGDHWVAGKTGTTDNHKDGWFCGYSKYYTTVVWCGYDTPRPVNNLYGATYPGHIWQDYMLKIHEGLEPKPFEEPSDIVWQTDENGNKDMFSREALDKKQEEEEKLKKEQSAKRQKEWEENEPVRQKEATELVEKYEKAHYKTAEDVETIDGLFDQASSAISIIDDKEVKQDLTARLTAHQTDITKEREVAVKLQQDKLNKLIEEKRQQEILDAQAKALAQEEIDKMNIAKQQEQIQIENQAVQALDNLEAYVGKSLTPEVQNVYNDVREKVAQVADQEKYQEYKQRLNKLEKELGFNN